MKTLKRNHISSDASSSSPVTTPTRSNSNSNSSPTSLSSSASSTSWNHLKSVLFVVATPANSRSPTDRIRQKSPWSRRKRIRALSPRQWKSFFTPDGKPQDDGVKMLRKVRSGGIDPSIRAEVWPFLLGVYSLDSTEEERENTQIRKRKEYEKLQRKCQKLYNNKSTNNNASGSSSSQVNSGLLVPGVSYADSEYAASARPSLSNETSCSSVDAMKKDSPNQWLEVVESSSRCVADSDTSFQNVDSSYSDSSEESDAIPESPFPEGWEEDKLDASPPIPSPPLRTEQKPTISIEDFTTWQRIIRLDAVRANSEWIDYSPSKVTLAEASRAAEAVGLKDYDHLEPSSIFHAARLVAILEAYALYDPEIGYCQGMGDLLSPIVTVIPQDHDAFWCFVGFMRKARHNFRLDEAGIKRQLCIISKIIKRKDSHLYKHLAKYQAEDCFFVYRMVLVLFRRELSFEQTLCLWEVIWADQAAIRSRIGKSAWSRIRQRAPPTDDLLLYAIAASVLQRRKLIIEKYSSMDEIIRECNNMAGQLDVWKLLDDAHNLVVTLHDKI